MLAVLRQGLGPNSDEARMAYIASHRGAWVAGWLCWSVTAVTLVALVVVLSRRVGTIIPIFFVIAGVYFDLSSQFFYMFALPNERPAGFHLLDRELEVSIGAAANGLYTLAIALLMLRGDRVPQRVRLLSIPFLVAGVVLVIGALMHSSVIEIASSAVLFPAFILWAVDVGRWLQHDG
jgi:hypothetical protein